jgi:ankyrin
VRLYTNSRIERIVQQNGFTPLHLAVVNGHADMVMLLLERGAEVNWRAKNGLTPLHLAAQEDAVPIAEMLVKFEAQIDPHTKVVRERVC